MQPVSPWTSFIDCLQPNSQDILSATEQCPTQPHHTMDSADDNITSTTPGTLTLNSHDAGDACVVESDSELTTMSASVPTSQVSVSCIQTTDDDKLMTTSSDTPESVCLAETETETENVSSVISINKDFPPSDASCGDTAACSDDSMENTDNGVVDLENRSQVVAVKQEKDLDLSSEVPQLTSQSTSTTDQLVVVKIEECAHDVEQKQSVAFQDLVPAFDRPDGETSCYLVDYRGTHRNDSSSSSIDSSDSDLALSDDDAGKMQKRKVEREKENGTAEILKTKGEMTLENLPPLEELHIVLAEDVEVEELGLVSSIIGLLVVVEAKAGVAALNVDSILFLEGRKVMGQVFETFGQVSSPFYSVRYNSRSDVERLGLEPGQTVFYAPSETQYTYYIFLDQLISLKGSDASWEHNNEPPQNFIEFSDDEEERRSKAKRRNKNKQNASGDHGGDDGGDRGGDRGETQGPQTKRNNNNRSRQGQGSLQSTQWSGQQDNGAPPRQITTPNPFSHMGRTPERGGAGQHQSPGLQQWPPPPSHMGEHSQFSSPPPRPHMFPGLDETSMGWRTNSPGWNQGNMNGHGQWGQMNNPSMNNPPMNNPPMNNPSMNNPPMNNPPMNNPSMNNPPMNNPSMNNPPMNNPSMNNPPMNNLPMNNPPMNNPPPFPPRGHSFMPGPTPAWQPFMQPRPHFGERPNFMPGPRNNWRP